MADPHRHLTEVGTLSPNSLYNTVWLDAMHDRMNYKATQATTDEDSLMTVNRHWPVALNAAPERFLQLFKEKYILQPKDNVINAIPGEMRIKDVYSGLFFGFALNEFIDQADTSTENYLKYYQTNKGLTINTTFDGLDKPPTGGDFPNSYLYNCDKILFEYFKQLTKTDQGGAVTPKYPYVDTQDQPQAPWGTNNCKKRHVYNLNCFWQELIETIHNDHIDVSGADNFDVNDINAAIEQLKRIEFTGFEMIKKPPLLGAPRGTGWIDFLYKYPKWKIKDDDDTKYFYVTTQGLCASHIPSGATKPNVLSRKLGKITKEQKSCFKGLKRLAYVIPLNGTPLTDDAKSHFFMLLKYAGDTSHLKLYEILNAAIPDNDLYKTNNLALYLSERPLLVRAFTKNMNVYCKYLAKFKDENIIKTPNEVFKLTNIGENVIGFMRAKNYMQDINDLIGRYNQHSDLNNLALVFVSLQAPNDDQASRGQASQLRDTTDDVPTPIPYIDHAIEVAKPDGNVKLPKLDQDKINRYHNSIKQILSLNELIFKTPSFIDDMKYVNERIIARKFFPTRTFRCPIIMHLKSVACPMIRSTFNKKNIEIFNRALQYLNAFNTLREINPPPVDNLIGRTLVDIYDQLNTQLETVILYYGDKFKTLNQISIGGGGGIPVKDVDPSILREWIDNEYTSESSMSNKLTDVGIQNITDYLILYDTLTHSIPVGQTGPGGGAAAQDGGSAEDDMKTIPMIEGGSGPADAEAEAKDDCGAAKVGNDETWWQSLELDADLIQQENEIITNALVGLDDDRYFEYIDALNNIDTKIDEIYCIESNTELGSTVDLKVRDITGDIHSLLDGVDDVDFLETLYYILQQFIYFNEMNGQYITLEGQAIYFNEPDNQYITRERLSYETLYGISNTIDKILTRAKALIPNIRLEEEIEWVKIEAAKAKATAEAERALTAQAVAAEYPVSVVDHNSLGLTLLDEAEGEAEGKAADEAAGKAADEAADEAAAVVGSLYNIGTMNKLLEPPIPYDHLENIFDLRADQANRRPMNEPRNRLSNPKKKNRVESRNELMKHSLNSKKKDRTESRKLTRKANRDLQRRNHRMGRGLSPSSLAQIVLGKRRARDIESFVLDGDFIYPKQLKQGGANKTRKKSKSSQLRKTIKKRRVKKIKRKSLRRKKPIKKRVNSKNRKVKRKIKNKTRKYKKPKKLKRSRKPKP